MGFQDMKGKLWMSGKWVDWADAQIHVLSHVVHYGSSVFEGMRAYATPRGPALFRLAEHTRRLFNSARIYRMDIPFSEAEINNAIIEMVELNGFDACYVRPVVYRGYKQLGVTPKGCPVEVTLACWHWGQYLGEEAVTGGVDVCVSSWNRLAPNTMPAMAKAGANYMNSQLIKMEALENGYVEGIALDHNGLVSEGSGENIFVLREDRLITPPFASSVLPGITRDTVMKFAAEMSIPVIEQSIPRELLYIADEVFFTGSAAEITPIRSIDRIPIGSGGRGPITKRLQERFFEYLEGRCDDTYGWMTYVKEVRAAVAT